MKKLLCLILVLFSALCLFSSCKDNDHELDITKTGTKIYILRKDDDGRMYFDYEYVILKSERREDRAKEMLEMLKNPGMDGAYITVPEYINFENITVKGSTLIIDLSENYKYLKPKEKTIATVSICKTLLSDGETRYISIKCQGEPQAPLYEGYVNNHTVLLDDRLYME
ncbi:MAG: GerMN domain-containing protein [Clostridia bacterium]|nr:GerMN domain-containing protein [Clostridia bacterium]